MVGPALPRVTSSEGFTQDEHHGDKPRWQAQRRSTFQHGSHPRHQQAKQFSEGNPGKRIGQRSLKGVDHRVGGAPDITGRINMPSSACPSGSTSHQPNLDRFLDETTPRVKTQTLRKSCLRDSLQKRWCNPEETPYFILGDLWDSFDEWSAYGVGVPLELTGGESVVQYYVPYLSALQLYTVPSRRLDSPHRHRGSESDTGSEASSDGESEKLFRGYKGAESPPPNLGGSFGHNSMLERKTYLNDDDEEVMVWSYFEKSPPCSRVPLVDKIADLSRGLKSESNPLRKLRSLDLLRKSWLSVAWYPIYRIPTGPTLRELAACFLTFHPLSTSLQDADCHLRQGCSSDGCVMPLPRFGLASYKLKGVVWIPSEREKDLTSELLHSADEHLKQLRVQHPDFNYFTSHSIPTRR